MPNIGEIIAAGLMGFGTGDPSAYLKQQQIRQSMQVALEKMKREADESAVDMQLKKWMVKKAEIESQKMEIEAQRLKEQAQFEQTPQTLQFPMEPEPSAPKQPSPEEATLRSDLMASGFTPAPKQPTTSRTVDVTFDPRKAQLFSKFGKEGEQAYLRSQMPPELYNQLFPKKGEEFTLGPGQARFKDGKKIAEMPKEVTSSLFRSPKEAQDFISSNPAAEGMVWSFKNTDKGWQVSQSKAPKEGGKWIRFTTNLGDTVKEGFYNNETQEERIISITPKTMKQSTFAEKWDKSKQMAIEKHGKNPTKTQIGEVFKSQFGAEGLLEGLLNMATQPKPTPKF